MKNRVSSPKMAPPGLIPDGGGGRIQIGGRVQEKMNSRLKLTSALTPYSKDDILEDALKLFFGVADAEVLKRQKEVQTKLKELAEGKLPFETPLTPNKNNATLTSRGDSPKLTFRFKRMGS